MNNNETVQEIIVYNEILDRIEADDRENGVWRFDCIQAHQGPLTQSNPNYKGSSYNLLIGWENREQSWEPLSVRNIVNRYKM